MIGMKVIGRGGEERTHSIELSARELVQLING